MRFTPTPLAGVMVVEIDPHADGRGFFARLSCPEDFAQAGIAFTPKQTSLSRNSACHTLRGMHVCTQPEAKLVRCTRGRIFDAVFDIRPHSPSCGQAFGRELDADSLVGLYLPAGVAHGFLTLEPDSDILYEIDRIWRPGFDAGLRWDDPAFPLAWPARPAVISPRDAHYPDFGTAPSP